MSVELVNEWNDAWARFYLKKRELAELNEELVEIKARMRSARVTPARPRERDVLPRESQA